MGSAKRAVHAARLVACAFACTATLLASAASAEAHEGVRRSPHTEESRFIVGLKGTFVSERAEEEVEQGGGLGSFIEATLIEHRLELELGVVGIFPGETAAQIAFEPFLKVSFYPIPVMAPYVGVGPIVLWGAEKPNLRGGGQIVLGSYFWVSPQVGIDVDVGFALLSGKEAMANELTLALGPVVRF